MLGRVFVIFVFSVLLSWFCFTFSPAGIIPFSTALPILPCVFISLAVFLLYLNYHLSHLGVSHLSLLRLLKHVRKRKKNKQKQMGRITILNK